MTVSEEFTKLPENTQQRIETKVAALIARASVKNALLSKDDIMMITGYSQTQLGRIMQDPAWPAPIVPIQNGHHKWRTAEVFAFFGAKKQLRWI